jgi:hypothetical protein
MRKVFSSQRLENVEAVAQLLREAGIAVKIENGRSYRGYLRGNFRYTARQMPEHLPSVWIVHAEDQPRGRQLLRELGLLEGSRPPAFDGADAAITASSSAPTRHPATGKRLRLALLALIAGVIALAVLQRPAPPAPSAPARAPATGNPMPVLETITETPVFRIEVPQTLARTLIEQTLRKKTPAIACLSVDGQDIPATTLASIQAPPNTRLLPASACPAGDALTIAVQDYMTDGSGRGDVTLKTGSSSVRTLHVVRDGRHWIVQGAR